jgi:DNA-binding SARP family transcriptional activator
MLDKLMDYCEARQEYETGLAYGARILRYDRARERTHRRLMRSHYLAGNRTDALRQYRRCVAALDEELGVPPSKQTVELYERIRADRLEQTSAVLPVCASSHALCAPMLRALHRLAELHLALLEIEPQIEQDIRSITPPQPPPADRTPYC